MIHFLVTAALAATASSTADARGQRRFGGPSSWPKSTCSWYNNPETVKEDCPLQACMEAALRRGSLNADQDMGRVRFKPSLAEEIEGCANFATSFTSQNVAIAPKCKNGKGSCIHNNYDDFAAGERSPNESIVFEVPLPSHGECKASVCMYAMDDKYVRENPLSTTRNQARFCVGSDASRCTTCQYQNMEVALPAEWCLRTKQTAIKKIENRGGYFGHLLTAPKDQHGFYSTELEEVLNEVVGDGCDKDMAIMPRPFEQTCAALGKETLYDVGVFVKDSAGLNAPIRDLIRALKHKHLHDPHEISHFAVHSYDKCPKLVQFLDSPPTGVSQDTLDALHPLKRGDGYNGFVAVACGADLPDIQPQ